MSEEDVCFMSSREELIELDADLLQEKLERFR